MKKVYLGMMVATALLGANLAQASTTVNFNGKVLPTSCTIALDGATGQTVTLPDTKDADFSSTTGFSTKTQNFAIDLNDCPRVMGSASLTRKVHWNVTSGQWQAKTGSGPLTLITNTAVGGATNVALYLSAQGGIAGDVPSGQVTASNFEFANTTLAGDDYPFTVGYTRLNNAVSVSPGAVVGSATFDVVYD